MISRVVAAACALASSPIMLAAAVLIKVASPGPVLFKADRVGRDGDVFSMYKLRTMHHKRGGGRITGANDERVFGTGRLLRRHKVDELPQLLNVVHGDMTIVGPRPEDPWIVELHYTPFMRQTLAVLPGLTSPGSLAYYAEESTLPSHSREAEGIYVADLLPRKIALDMVYVQNQSQRYQVELVLRTIAGVVGFHGLFPKRQMWERHEAERLLVESRRRSCSRAESTR